MLSHFSRVQLFATPWTVARQALLSTGFSRQEHWSGLLWPPPGDLPDPGMEHRSLMSPALAGGFFTVMKVMLNNQCKAPRLIKKKTQVHKMLKQKPCWERKVGEGKRQTSSPSREQEPRAEAPPNSLERCSLRSQAGWGPLPSGLNTSPGPGLRSGLPTRFLQRHNPSTE